MELIIFGFCGLLLFQIVFFFYKNKHLKTLHTKTMTDLKRNLRFHREQMRFRNSNLDKYHFLRYNLEEVLIFQK